MFLFILYFRNFFSTFCIIQHLLFTPHCVKESKQYVVNQMFTNMPAKTKPTFAYSFTSWQI